jgi:hypothetical protein
VRPEASGRALTTGSCIYIPGLGYCHKDFCGISLKLIIFDGYIVDGNCRVEISNLCTFIRVFAASIISHLDTKPVQSFKN